MSVIHQRLLEHAGSIAARNCPHECDDMITSEEFWAGLTKQDCIDYCENHALKDNWLDVAPMGTTFEPTFERYKFSASYRFMAVPLVKSKRFLSMLQ